MCVAVPAVVAPANLALQNTVYQSSTYAVGTYQYTADFRGVWDALAGARRLAQGGVKCAAPVSGLPRGLTPYVPDTSMCAYLRGQVSAPPLQAGASAPRHGCRWVPGQAPTLQFPCLAFLTIGLRKCPQDCTGPVKIKVPCLHPRVSCQTWGQAPLPFVRPTQAHQSP